MSNATRHPRDSHGRFRADHHLRNLAIGLGAFAAGTVALAAGAVALVARRADAAGQGEGHAAPDLAAGESLGPDHRAPDAFRPDIDAPMTAAERDALRPATGPSPSLVSDEGGTVQGVGHG